jgi:hypothetical protein
MHFALFMVLCFLNDSGTTWNFDNATVGELPKGWTATKTGEGPGSEWKIVQDGKDKVLAQTSSEGSKRLFNVCVADEPKLADLELIVSIKPIDGKTDQGGGPVWRYQDANNYYVCRWNPLEDNLRLYQVVNGKRIQMDHADLKAPIDQWHTLRITQVGKRIFGYFDGQKLIEAEDNTIPDAGQVGLWSKSDAVTHFKDLSVGPAK